MLHIFVDADACPVKQRLLVQCKSELEGDEIIEQCKVACTACGRCAADAAQGLLKMKNNLPVINHDLLHLQTTAAVGRCPTQAIVWIEGQQFPKAHVVKSENLKTTQ